MGILPPAKEVEMKDGYRLSWKEREAVKGWLNFLDFSKQRKCPFYDLGSLYCAVETGKRDRRFRFCKSWFPRIKIGNCPCFKYGLPSVVQRALRMVSLKTSSGVKA